MSGFVAAKLTKDKTTREAVDALKTWMFNYGFCSTVRTDGGPSFRDAFSEEMEKLGVRHTLSSSYNPQSNGGAERVVRSLREVLDKRGGKKTSQMELSEICFKVNCITQPSGQGSASERFLKRKPKSLLPASMEEVVDHQQMIRKRQEAQLAISKKKGRVSIDQFEEGDRVVIQSPQNGKWLEKGVIEKKRVAADGSSQSFQIKMEDGSVKLRNKRFIRHAVKEGPAKQVNIDPNNVQLVYDDVTPAQALGDSHAGQAVLEADLRESRRPYTRQQARQLSESSE